jgi:hypothetical protein
MEDINNNENLKQEALLKIKPFVEEKITNGELWIWGNHGHLGYQDDKFWGHYIFPTKSGVEVKVYLKENIKGDPMDIEGERGPSFDISVPLDQSVRVKLLEKMREDLKKHETEGFKDLEELENAIFEVESGIGN